LVSAIAAPDPFDKLNVVSSSQSRDRIHSFFEVSNAEWDGDDEEIVTYQLVNIPTPILASLDGFGHT
jgi:hypothetical protein